MIELGAFAREGRLGAALAEAEWLQPANRVEGLSLSYDARFIGVAAFLVRARWPQNQTDTVEFSSHVAALLARAAATLERDERSFPETSGYPTEDAWSLASWWKSLSRYDWDVPESPITVEVTTGAEFEGPANFEDRARSPLGRYGFRRREAPKVKRRSTAHSASTGGRFTPDATTNGQTWGTVGGYLIDSTNERNVFAVTAAHVCDGQGGRIQPTLFPKGGRFIRESARGLLFVSKRLLPLRYRGIKCSHMSESVADIVSPYECDASQNPALAGLDAAILKVDQPNHSRLRGAKIAFTPQVSQLLPLTLIGASSGYRQVAITSYSLWHSYERADGSHLCVHDCLQIRLRERPYFRTDLSTGGDSGAWLLARGQDGPYWVGMLTGGDGDRAGIVPASRISRHFEVVVQSPLEPAI